MEKYPYYVVDVFTDKRFSGNPLAVIPNADGIDGAKMLSIAAEFNLSETVFVLDSEAALRRLRIFTPTGELALAGHPVIGAWKILSELGVIPETGDRSVSVEQELNVGILPVEIEMKGSICSRVTMKQAGFERIQTLETPEIEQLASGLGIVVGDIGNSRISTCDVISTGIRSIAVPLHSAEILANAELATGHIKSLCDRYDSTGVYVYCFETNEADNDVAARFFAPSVGISEDPATGSAAGALAANLVSRGALEAGLINIEQGDFMGRPSRITTKVEGFDDVVTSVYVSGTAVTVMKGELYL